MDITSPSSSTVIPVHCDDSSNDLPHWTLIEVNGELLSPKEMPTQSLSSLQHSEICCELGCIWFDKGNVPVLIIGSHELRGSIEFLAQPFYVLEKQLDDSSYAIRGIIDRKLLFRQYPKTLIR